MKNKLLAVIIMIAVGFTTIPIYADGDAGQAAAYLKMGVGGRALGMGGAFTAIADDSTAAFWNPAGLAQLSKREIGAMHAQLKLDRKYNFINFVTPLTNSRTKAVMGFSYIRFGVDDISETHIWRWAGPGNTAASRNLIYGTAIKDSRGKNIPVTVSDTALKNTLDTGTVSTTGQVTSYDWSTSGYASNNVEIFSAFNDVESSYAVSYSQALNDRVLLGANLKYLTQHLFDYDANTFAMDLGAMYYANEKVTFGLSVRDLFAKLKWDTPSGSSDDVPISTTLGVAYQPKQNLILSFDINKIENLKTKLRFGIETWIKEKFGLRMGSNDADFTVGASFRIPEWQFDYAFRDEELGDEHRISAARKF